MVDTVIKLKRSETASAVPTQANLEVGEVALNLADKVLYTKGTDGAVVAVSNYVVGDANLVFPTGDYGDMTASSVDAFGVATERSYDCRTAPPGILTTEDFGTL